ncbi:MAG: 4Fe-4S dicluster domain-containing protein [bacterium]
MRYAMLNDVTRCIGCRSCQVACKQWNERKAEKTKNVGTFENPFDLSGQTWKRVKFVETEKNGAASWSFFTYQCNHCGDAGCMAVCPTNAIKRTKEGAVYIDEKICTGCKYCLNACPFHVPRIDEDKHIASKCNLCADRIASGLMPSCAKACPTGAIMFGSRDYILTVARERASLLSKNGKNNFTVYGENVLGGLGVIYLLPESPETYALPERPKAPPAVNFVNVFSNSFVGLIAALILTFGAYASFKKGGEK